MCSLAVWGLSDCRHRGVRGSTLLRAGLDSSRPLPGLGSTSPGDGIIAWQEVADSHTRLTVSLPYCPEKAGVAFLPGVHLCVPEDSAPVCSPFRPIDWWLEQQGSRESSDEPLWADTHLQAANLCSWKRVVELREEEGLPPEEWEGVARAYFPTHNSEALPPTP